LFTDKQTVNFYFIISFYYLIFLCLEQQQHQEESQYDYASVIDQMATKINVRYGNSIMEEGEPFVSGKILFRISTKNRFLLFRQLSRKITCY
jgi:hypothetical protein